LETLLVDDDHKECALFSAVVDRVDLSVVLFSAFACRGTIETALAMGANAFIAKPLELRFWKAAVRQIWELGGNGANR